MILFAMSVTSNNYSLIAMSTIRDSIISFIKSVWDSRDEERYIRLSEEDEEDEDTNELESSYRTDPSHVINDLDEDTINFLDTMIGKITNTKIFLMDKDSMIPWEASGYYVKLNGDIVIFHER